MDDAATGIVAYRGELLGLTLDQRQGLAELLAQRDRQ
jgi:hypothetical protein